jgi:hypothetical protein
MKNGVGGRMSGLQTDQGQSRPALFVLVFRRLGRVAHELLPSLCKMLGRKASGL